MIRIAILEDDIRVAKFISTGLSAESYLVDIFTSIEEFIDILQMQKFDILILDRMIGKEDTLTKLKGIKNTNHNINE